MCFLQFGGCIIVLFYNETMIIRHRTIVSEIDDDGRLSYINLTCSATNE